MTSHHLPHKSKVLSLIVKVRYHVVFHPPYAYLSKCKGKAACNRTPWGLTLDLWITFSMGIKLGRSDLNQLSQVILGKQSPKLSGLSLSFSVNFLQMHPSGGHSILSANTGPTQRSLVHLTQYYNYMFPCLLPLWVPEYGKCVLCILVSLTSTTLCSTAGVQYLLIYCSTVHTRIKRNWNKLKCHHLGTT